MKIIAITAWAQWQPFFVDGITIKIARVGGVTRARQIRDVAVDCGLGVEVDPAPFGAPLFDLKKA